MNILHLNPKLSGHYGYWFFVLFERTRRYISSRTTFTEFLELTSNHHLQPNTSYNPQRLQHRVISGWFLLEGVYQRHSSSLGFKTLKQQIVYLNVSSVFITQFLGMQMVQGTRSFSWQRSQGNTVWKVQSRRLCVRGCPRGCSAFTSTSALISIILFFFLH